MKFHTDHYFHIGSAHYVSGKPCQDHALSVSKDNYAAAIISDGCSTGGNTDVGSRVLTLSTLQAIRDHAKASDGALNIEKATISITSRQQQIISTARLMLGMEHSDMLATCGYAYITKSGGFIHLQGDGVIAMKYRNGELRMFRYEWDNNMPFYPAYADGVTDNFIRSHGGDLNAKRLHLETAKRHLNGDVDEGFERHYTLGEGINGIIINIPESELGMIEYIAVFSDGVTQVENIDWKNAVIDFLSFKSVAGDFAKRRMIRGIKDMQKNGRGPVDDIAYAVVRIELDEEEAKKGDDSEHEGGA